MGVTSVSGHRYKNHLIAAAVLSVLATIGTIMNSRQASAQDGGPKVTIDSPIPLPVTGTVGISGPVNINAASALPVTGSTTVSGAVAATQSGTWNVGITGTPNVNVTNPATAPALFLNVNDPGRIPHQSQRTCFTQVRDCGVVTGLEVLGATLILLFMPLCAVDRRGTAQPERSRKVERPLIARKQATTRLPDWGALTSRAARESLVRVW